MPPKQPFTQHLINEKLNPAFFTSESEWDTAVIIPTLGRPQYLHNVIQALYNQTVLPKEIVVIDQSDMIDIDTGTLRKFGSEVAFSYYHLNVCSKKAALNWGLRLTKSPIIVSVDDDTEFDAALIFNHLLSLYEHRADNINGATVRHNQHLLTSPRRPRFWEDAVTTLTHNRMVDYPCMTLQVNGCNCSFKRSILLKVNGWDETAGIASDDDEMSMKLFKYGGKMIYDPRPKVVHLKAPSGGWRDLWSKTLYGSFLKRQLQYPHAR